MPQGVLLTDVSMRRSSARVRVGANPRALARAISRAEAGRGGELIRALYPKTGHAMTIGLTGPPGVGKSTLASELVRNARARGKRVGVVSVDPSSPFSHGALLGDRIRLAEHFTDDRRLHSLDGESRTSRRPRRRDRRRRAADGRLRLRSSCSSKRSASVRARLQLRNSRRRRWSRCSPEAAIRFRCSKPASWRLPTFSSSTKPITRWPINCGARFAR